VARVREEINMHTVVFAGVAYLVGVFTPAVSRKVKSWFSKEASVVKADVVKAEADVKAKI